MSKRAKIVLVTAKHHPLHQVWVKVAERVAKELGLDLEVREEDYVYVNEFGDKDEYGMAWLPQLFLEFADGKVILLLSRMPLDPTHKPDTEEAVRLALEKARSALAS